MAWPERQPTGNPKGVRQEKQAYTHNNDELEKHLERCRAQQLCYVPECYRPHAPFCTYHERLYQYPGQLCYDFYLRLHTGTCVYCGVPIDRPGPVVCDLHFDPFMRRIEQILSAEFMRNQSKLRSLESKGERWRLYGPPIRLRPWEWA